MYDNQRGEIKKNPHAKRERRWCYYVNMLMDKKRKERESVRDKNSLDHFDFCGGFP